MKKILVTLWMVLGLALLSTCAFADEEQPGWQNKGYFSLKNQDGRWILLDPKGKPFYSIGMVYDYGPDFGPSQSQITAEAVLAELQKMKDHGYNTLDLYGRSFLDEILDWCDRNEMAVYLRTSYSEVKGLTPERMEYPDFMDNEFRIAVKNFMSGIMTDVMDYHSVLAIDMDQRWLFSVDWDGARRGGEPRLGPEGIKYFPTWLEKKFQDISKLNEAWGKSYQQFADVINDTDIIEGGRVNDLQTHPWRVDVIDYTLWTINDFLKDLTETMRAINPNHLITITTELPEVIPFPISTKENSGVDFISPVHYNHSSDFGRDWIGNARLLAQTKFQSDISGLPSYINETGFRTEALHQRPPNMNYAMSRANDEEHKAKLYVEQMTLMNTYPWLLGWSYFKWFDKWPEGDFGYVANDGSLRPISKLGKLANPYMQINWEAEKNPHVYVYYPSYALAAPKASLQQFKSLTLFLANPFLKAHQKLFNDAMSVLGNLETLEGTTLGLFSNLVESFNEKWIPFLFTQQLNNTSVVILAGNALEMLSESDRAQLLNLKTITFGPVGLYTERFKETTPWFLEAIGLPKDAFEEKYIPQDLGLNASTGDDKYVTALKGKTRFILPETSEGNLKYISCQGQALEVPQGVYTNIDFLMASTAGDLAQKVIIKYSDGSVEEQYLGATLGDFRFVPNFNPVGWKGKVQDDRFGYLSYIRVSVNASKTLTSIVLPKEEAIHVYAFTLVEDGEARNVKAVVKFGDKKAEGMTPWLFTLREGVGEYTVLATFENGRPAVVQSKDGKHIAFLYDALTWKKSSGEISQDVDFHSALIQDLINRLEGKKS